jgi:hypothetical protein
MRMINAIVSFRHSDDGINVNTYEQGAQSVSDECARVAIAEGWAVACEDVAEVNAGPLKGSDPDQTGSQAGDAPSSSAAEQAPSDPTSDPSPTPSSASTSAGDSAPTPPASTPATAAGGAVKKGKKPSKASAG